MSAALITRRGIFCTAGAAAVVAAMPASTPMERAASDLENCHCPACGGSGNGRGDVDTCGYCGGDGSVPVFAAMKGR
jgi:hypothetical protein